MRSVRRLTACIGVVAVAATAGTGWSSPAFGAAGVVEEIVVTARKREENLQDVPVAVTAVTGEMFERAAIADFKDAAALVPGFSVSPGAVTPQALNLSIRGNSHGSALITEDPAVGVYVDGVYVARPYGIGVDFLDLESIQVLKGPQGTLFGRNSTAGAVLFETSDPELGEFTGSVGLTGGTDHTRGEIVLNVPLGEMFALRAAYQRRERDDYVDSVANDPNNPLYTQFNATAPYVPAKTFDSEIGGFENDTGRVKLRFAPTDALDMSLSYARYESDLVGPVRETVWLGGEPIPRDEDDDTVSLSFDPRAYAETETTIFDLTHESDLGQLRFIASTREYRSLNEADYDGGDYAAPPLDLSALFGFPPGSIVSIRRHGSWGRSEGDQDSVELQFITSVLDDRLDWTSGVLYFKEDAVYYDYSLGTSPYEAVATTGSVTAGGNWVSQTTDSLGIYTQGTFSVTDASNLTLGLRYTQDDKEALIWGSSADVVISVLPSWDFEAYRETLTSRSGNLVIRRPSETFDSVDWMVSYDYRLNEDLMVYGKVATAFRAGGFNGRGLDDLNASPVYEPEELIEYELGLKGAFLDDRLRWNTAVYKNETEEKQFTVLVANSVPGAPPGTNVRNAGKAEATGFETELTYVWSDAWSLSASYAYVDSEIKELEQFNPATGTIEPLPDERLPTIGGDGSEWTLALNYDRSFRSMRVAATALYHWQDEQTFAAQSPAQIVATSAFSLAEAQSWVDAATSDAYGLLNTSVALSTLNGRYSLTLWGRNLLDERTMTSGIAFISGGAYQYATASYTEPRALGATLEVSF